MPKFEVNAAQEVLVDHGVIERRSYLKAAIIGCIGCRWLTAEEAGQPIRTYGYEIAQCLGGNPGMVYPVLQRLAEGGAVLAQAEDDGTLGPPRVYYYPADTEVGVEFTESLVKPKHCELEEDR